VPEQKAHCTDHETYEPSCRYCRMRRRLQLHDQYIEDTDKENE
jgi:hypothetical protein